jgi:hypothetical protein
VPQPDSPVSVACDGPVNPSSRWLGSRSPLGWPEKFNWDSDDERPASPLPYWHRKPPKDDWCAHHPDCVMFSAQGEERCIGDRCTEWPEGKGLPRPTGKRRRTRSPRSLKEFRSPGVHESERVPVPPALVIEDSPDKKMDHSSIKLCLPAGKLSGSILEHCVAQVRSILKWPRTFKIGLTRDPEHRWSNVKYGYQKEQCYSVMVVIGETDTAEGAAFLEASLIGKFSEMSGCRNKARGGEGLRGATTAGPYFVYIVHGPLES